QVRHLEAHFCIPLPLPHDIRWRKDLAGGALMDTGCYTVSVLRHLAGAEPEVVSAQGWWTRGGVDRAMGASLRFPDGRTARLTCSLFSAWLLRASAALLAAVILGQAVPAPAAPQILLRSGDAAADGLRLDGFRLPVASSAGQVALLATTSGILREDGGVLSVVAKTGDPLPAPLAGAFGSLSGAAIADGGAIAFAATLDSPSAGAGIFVASPGGVVARVLEPGPVASIDRPAL